MRLCVFFPPSAMSCRRPMTRAVRAPSRRRIAPSAPPRVRPARTTAAGTSARMSAACAVGSPASSAASRVAWTTPAVPGTSASCADDDDDGPFPAVLRRGSHRVRSIAAASATRAPGDAQIASRTAGSFARSARQRIASAVDASPTVSWRLSSPSSSIATTAPRSRHRMSASATSGTATMASWWSKKRVTLARRRSALARLRSTSTDPMSSESAPTTSAASRLSVAGSTETFSPNAVCCCAAASSIEATPTAAATMDDAAKPIERTTAALDLAVGVPTGPTPPAPRIAGRDAPPADGGGARAPRAARARNPRSLTSRPTRRIARVAWHRDVGESWIVPQSIWSWRRGRVSGAARGEGCRRFGDRT